MKTRIGLLLVAAMFAGCGSSRNAGDTATQKPLVPVSVTVSAPLQKPDNGGDAAREKILNASQSFSVSVTASDIATPITGTANKSATGITTITLLVPVGTARAFTAKAFDASGATGNTISRGSVTQDIIGGTNNIDMTMNAVPRSITSPNPASTTAGGATLAFSANDADSTVISNSPTTLVNWSVTGGAANGTISSSGVYTPPATNPGAPSATTVTIQAVSALDGTLSAISATLTLN